MKNLVGKTWGELDLDTQKMLLENVNAVDGRTGNDSTETGDCIIDFGNGLSVSGYVRVDDDGNSLTIKSSAIIYDPSV